jgi:hypothetical protein
VEDSGVLSAFIEGFVIFDGPNPISPNPNSGIIPQTFISVKPLYAWFGHYIPQTMVCQAHFMHKKISQNQEKLSIIVIKIYKGLINI